jgi:hypothetical protein
MRQNENRRSEVRGVVFKSRIECRVNDVKEANDLRYHRRSYGKQNRNIEEGGTTLKRKIAMGSVIAVLVLTLFTLSVLATDGEIYFSSDKNGQNRVTNIQEGDEVWICVYDPDENIDCDVRDKFWTDIKIMDPKTGAYIVWISYKYPNSDEPGKTGDAEEDLYWGSEYEPYKGHYPGNNAGSTAFDYMEETGADTGRFTSSRSYLVGTRVDFADPVNNTHVVSQLFDDPGDGRWPVHFQGGNWLYGAGVIRGAVAAPGAGIDLGEHASFVPWFEIPPEMYECHCLVPFLPPFGEFGVEELSDYMLGRFENMDTLVGMYVDPNDATDVAVSMMKIIDTEATISWDMEVYKDANGSATITVKDYDENLNCNRAEWVPVWIIVNPGSWNPVNRVQTDPLVVPSPTDFCLLKVTGGVDPDDGDNTDPRLGDYEGWDTTIRWFNVYNSTLDEKDLENKQPKAAGSYYMEYPTLAEFSAGGNVTGFDTADPAGFCRVMFFAQETGVDTGVFQLNLNSILDDLGFNALDVRDVLVAYYLDPNDFDDFKLSVAYIEQRQHSVTTFTDENRSPKDLFWIGRDPVYVSVIDANANVDPCCPEQVLVCIQDVHWEDDIEWYVLNETSSNSPIFFTDSGIPLLPVFDALGVSAGPLALLPIGGFQLWPDNWRLEVYNEDSVYARYNDVYYTNNMWGMQGVGDSNPLTAAPPWISRVRVDNDISFDLMEIADTQVYDGTKVNMYFLDRNGNRVSGYVNSDCVFVEVVDPDQDEDQYRRERIDAYWDGGQNLPFGPWDFDENHEGDCGFEEAIFHPVNDLLGDTNIFRDSPFYLIDFDGQDQYGLAKLYVLNPRNGRWAAVDLLETGPATGDFISVTCIDLSTQYECLPMLGVLPGDTIIGVYQDPSNHSDSCWISIKVGIGGGGTPPGEEADAEFVDAAGNIVSHYTDIDDVYVRVVDASHAGAASLQDAVEIGAQAFDLSPLAGAANDTFITDAISMTLLGVGAGDSITATYTDPTDPTDVAEDTISIISSELEVEEFITQPNPFDDEVTFTYEGSGIATTFSVTVYDLSRKVVWSEELPNVSEVTWDGLNLDGEEVASGPYIYVIVASDGTNTFTGKGVFAKH